MAHMFAEYNSMKPMINSNNNREENKNDNFSQVINYGHQHGGGLGSAPSSQSQSQSRQAPTNTNSNTNNGGSNDAPNTAEAKDQSAFNPDSTATRTNARNRSNIREEKDDYCCMYVGFKTDLSSGCEGCEGFRKQKANDIARIAGKAFVENFGIAESFNKDTLMLAFMVANYLKKDPFDLESIVRKVRNGTRQDAAFLDEKLPMYPFDMRHHKKLDEWWRLRCTSEDKMRWLRSMKCVFNEKVIETYKTYIKKNKSWSTQKILNKICECKIFENLHWVFRLFESFPASDARGKFCKVSYARWKEIFKWIMDGYLDKIEKTWSINYLLLKNKNKSKYDYNYEIEWFGKYPRFNNRRAKIWGKLKTQLQEHKNRFHTIMKRAKDKCIKLDFILMAIACSVIQQKVNCSNSSKVSDSTTVNSNNSNSGARIVNGSTNEISLKSIKVNFESVLNEINNYDAKVEQKDNDKDEMKNSLDNRTTKNERINIDNEFESKREEIVFNVQSNADKSLHQLRKLGQLKSIWVVVDMYKQDSDYDPKIHNIGKQMADKYTKHVLDGTTDPEKVNKIGLVWLRDKSHLALKFCICVGDDGTVEELDHIYHEIKRVANGSNGKIELIENFEDIDINSMFESDGKSNYEEDFDFDFGWLDHHKEKMKDYTMAIYSILKEVIKSKNLKLCDYDGIPRRNIVRRILSVSYKRWDEIIQYLKKVGDGEKLNKQIQNEYELFKLNRGEECRFAFGVESVYAHCSPVNSVIELERKQFKAKFARLKQISMFIDIIRLGMVCYIVEKAVGADKNRHIPLNHILTCLDSGKKELNFNLFADLKQSSGFNLMQYKNSKNCQNAKLVYSQLRQLHVLRRRRKWNNGIDDSVADENVRNYNTTNMTNNNMENYYKKHKNEKWKDTAITSRCQHGSTTPPPPPNCDLTSTRPMDVNFGNNNNHNNNHSNNSYNCRQRITDGSVSLRIPNRSNQKGNG